MLGTPNETSEDVEKIIRLIENIRPYFVLVFFMTPYPGTELAGLISKHFSIEDIINADDEVNYIVKNICLHDVFQSAERIREIVRFVSPEGSHMTL